MTRSHLIYLLRTGKWNDWDTFPVISELYDVVRWEQERGWYIEYIPTAGKGLPAIWEFGGASTHLGQAQVVGNRDGQPKVPIYVRKRGHLSCGAHGLFVVRPGMKIATCRRYRRQWVAALFEVRDVIKGITPNTGLIPLRLIDAYMGINNEAAWDIETEHAAIINAVIDKAHCYHCRELHFWREPDRDRAKRPEQECECGQEHE